MSIMLYKYPGPGKGKHFLHKIHVDYVVIEPKDLDKHLNEGWERSPKKAKELYEKVVSGELFPEKTANDEQVNPDDQPDKEIENLGDFEVNTDVVDPQKKFESDNYESQNDVEHLFDSAVEKNDFDSGPSFGKELATETGVRSEVSEDDYLSAYNQDDQEETEKSEGKRGKKKKK